MATQTVDTLLIKIQADLKDLKAGLNNATGQLDKFGKNTDKQVGLIGAGFKRLGPLITTYFGVQTVRSITNTVVSFEKLKASLVTVTGSAESADSAFAMIKDFAKTTPFQVETITAAFIRLKALGLDPSEESLRSFGNTSSAMGTDIMQFIEAVADATTGEFERLKEFGIRASQQGDQVAFTFQGVTKTVKKNAADIQQYLKDIGNVQFAGATRKQMDTLGGSFSNLQDSASALADAIGEAGLSAAFKNAANSASGLFQEITKGIQAATGEYNANNELIKSLIQEKVLQDKLDEARKKANGEYSALVYNLEQLLNQKRAEIRLLRDEVADLNNSTEAIERNRLARLEQFKEIDKSLIPQKRKNDYLKQEIELLKEIGLSDAELERRDIRGKLFLLNSEYVKGAMSAEDNARAIKFLTDRLNELSVPLEFIKKSELPKKQLLDSDYLDRLSNESIPKIKNELDKFAESAADVQNNLINFAMAGVGTIEDSFVNLINGTKSVKDAFKDMANSIINDIIRMTVRQSISGPISQLLSGFIAGIGAPGVGTGGGYGVSGSLSGAIQQQSALGQGFTNAFNSMIPNFGRAGGGSVSPNMPYMVGERGPELFVPSMSGRIVNNSNIGNAGKSVEVNQVINISAGVSQTVKAEIMALMPTIKQQTLSAVADAKMRGGAFSKVF